MLADRERNQQELVKGSEKKGLNISFKKRECMAVSKGNGPRCELQIGDAKIMFNILTENGKCNHEICIRIVKYKLSKILRIRKILLETKRVLNFCNISPIW